MEKTHRITYRFDQNGRKIDEHGKSSRVMNKSEANIEETVQGEMQPPVTFRRSSANMELEQLEQLIRSTDAGNQENVSRRSRILSDQPTDVQHEQKYSEELNGNPITSEVNQGLSLNEVHSATTDEAQLISTEEEQKVKQLIAIDALDELELWLKETDRKSKRLDERMQQAAREQVPPSVEDYTDDSAVEQEDGQYFLSSKTKNQQARPTLTWTQGAISVVCAIISGCLIGYLLLTLVFGINVWPVSKLVESNPQHISAQGNLTEEDLPATDKQQNDPATVIVQESDSRALNAQSYQYYVLQAGIFTQENTRDDVINSLKQSGYAAEFTLDDSNRFVVYAGLAASVNDADYVQSSIKGIETYRKPLNITLPEAMSFKGEAELLEQYFEESNSLIKMYADLVAVQLEQSSLSPIGEAAQSAWQSNYNSWLAISEKIADQWGSDAQMQHATEFQQALQEANAELLNYQSEAKTKYLWNVQRALVKSVLVQKDWFVQVNAL